MRIPTRPSGAGAALAVLLPLLAGCGPEAEVPVPEARPVRALQVAAQPAAVPIVLTGRIEAEDEVALAFRLGGRLLERNVAAGDRVRPGQTIARLEPRNELNALRTAEADLAAAQGQLDEARSEYGRQRHLEERGWAARAVYERARQAYQTAQARVDAAYARLKFARDQVAFTELEADAEGVVVAVAAEPGEVVAAGQTIVRLAREGGRDAVFDVPAQVLRTAPAKPRIVVELADDPTVRAEGHVREVSPEADPVTRTFRVKVGLSEPPPAMLLGSTVVGRMEVEAEEAILIPASALVRSDSKPAVWVVDPASSTVALRPIEVARFDTTSIAVADGLVPGDTVVTAGVQLLHPGQKVRLLGGAS